MVNKNLFKTGAVATAPKPNTTNRAGGKAFSRTDAEALCQYVVTCCFGNTYYATAGEQLEEIKNIVANVDSEIIAKAAVYGAEKGRMKDAPIYLLASLFARHETELVRKVFPRVVKSAKMLTNFVQIVRSGVTGRSSFGTVGKNLIRNWFDNRPASAIFNASIGQSQPSFADVIKMVHPVPTNDEKKALYAYLIGKPYDNVSLPSNVQLFETFKRGELAEVPQVPFRALTNCNLTVDNWRAIGSNMPWNTLRMNLNMLARKGCFDGDVGVEFANSVAKTLSNEELVRKFNAFPYQLFTAYQNTNGLPKPVQNALQDALDVSVSNVPKLGTGVTVLFDLSGSMGSPVTGRYGIGGHVSVTTCLDVASLMAATMVRNNDNARAVAYADYAANVEFNSRDSVVSIARNFRNQVGKVGHGTNLNSAFDLLERDKVKGDAVVVVSDMETWRNTYYGGNCAVGWAKYKRHNPNAKLVLINLQPGATVSVPDDKSVLNVGGFNDSVFDVINNFVTNDSQHFLDVISSIEL